MDAGLPPDRPEARVVQPDEQRIAAGAEGYRAHRVPAGAERELLAGADVAAELALRRLPPPAR